MKHASSFFSVLVNEVPAQLKIQFFSILCRLLTPYNTFEALQGWSMRILNLLLYSTDQQSLSQTTSYFRMHDAILPMSEDYDAKINRFARRLTVSVTEEDQVQLQTFLLEAIFSDFKAFWQHQLEWIEKNEQASKIRVISAFSAYLSVIWKRKTKDNTTEFIRLVKDILSLLKERYISASNIMHEMPTGWTIWQCMLSAIIQFVTAMSMHISFELRSLIWQLLREELTDLLKEVPVGFFPVTLLYVLFPVLGGGGQDNEYDVNNGRIAHDLFFDRKEELVDCLLELGLLWCTGTENNKPLLRKGTFLLDMFQRGYDSTILTREVREKLDRALSEQILKRIYFNLIASSKNTSLGETINRSIITSSRSLLQRRLEAKVTVKDIATIDFCKQSRDNLQFKSEFDFFWATYIIEGSASTLPQLQIIMSICADFHVQKLPQLMSDENLIRIFNLFKKCICLPFESTSNKVQHESAYYRQVEAKEISGEAFINLVKYISTIRTVFSTQDQILLDWLLNQIRNDHQEEIDSWHWRKICLVIIQIVYFKQQLNLTEQNRLNVFDAILPILH